MVRLIVVLSLIYCLLACLRLIDERIIGQPEPRQLDRGRERGALLQRAQRDLLSDPATATQVYLSIYLSRYRVLSIPIFVRDGLLIWCASLCRPVHATTGASRSRRHQVRAEARQHHVPGSHFAWRQDGGRARSWRCGGTYWSFISQLLVHEG